MRTIKTIIAAGGMLSGLVLFLAQPALAQGDASGHGMKMNHENMHEKAEEGAAHAMAGIHGGEVTMTAGHHFETLFTAEGIRLYVYDQDQKPVDVLKDAKATVVLETKDGKTESVPLDPLSLDEKAGRTQPCFAAPYEFSKMKPETMRATFEVQGLAKKPIGFQTSVSLMRQTLYTCSMDSDVLAEDPGSCPKCGMDLVPRSDDTGSSMGRMGSGR